MFILYYITLYCIVLYYITAFYWLRDLRAVGVVLRVDEDVDGAHGHEHEPVSGLAVVGHHGARGEVERLGEEHELGFAVGHGC